MTDVNTDFAVDTPSTVIDTETTTNPSGAGAPRTLPAEEPSLRDTIANAVKEADKGDEPDADEPAKDDDAAKGEEKSEEGEPEKEGEKDAKAEKEPRGDGEEKPKADPKPEPKPEAKPEENNRRHIDPPKNFLPDAKEHWRNTPRSVQRDIEVMARTHEEEISRHREAAERYDAIRQFDDMARQNGGDLRQSLERVVQIEQQFAHNPLAAINTVLQQAGPRKADGQPFSLYEVAQFVVQQGPQGYQQMMQQAQQQMHASQPTPEQQQIEQLRAKVQEIESQRVAATVIEPFAREHPRYYELQADIAFFLQSGKIPTSLSPADRLEAAYAMAERFNPPSMAASDTEAGGPAPIDRVDTSSGSKSIKTGPGAVSPTTAPEDGGSIRDLLQDELKKRRA